LKDGDVYCFPTFKALEGKDGEPITSEQLDVICSPCFYKLLNFIFAHPKFLGNATAEDVRAANAFFDIICTRADNQWCILTLQDKFCDDKEDNNVTDINCLINNLNTLCKDRCFKKIVAKLWLFADPTSQEAQDLQAFLKFACIENDGEYCLVNFFNGLTAFNDTCPDATWKSEGCTNTVCKDDATAFVGTMGCCMQTYLDFAKSTGTVDEKNEAVATEQKIKTAPCSITVPAACPRKSGVSKAEKKFYIRMTWFWAAEHDDAVKAAVIRDLAAFLGVPEEDVELVTFEKDNDELTDDEAGVVIEFNAQGQNDGETDAIGGDFDTAIADSKLSLPSTAKIYGSQGILSASGSPSGEGVSSASATGVVAFFSLAMIALSNLF